MKLFALLSIVGFASAVSVLTPPVTQPQQGGLEWRWQPGKTYTYDYQSRMLTGLPELAPHYSGLGLRARVQLEVRSNTRFVISITEPKYVRVSQVLKPSQQDQASQQGQGQGQEGQGQQSFWGYQNDNWRFLELPQFTAVPEEFVRYLARPTEIEFNENGSFKQMTLLKNAPEWVVNFKKALVGVIQTQFRQGNEAIEQNQIPTLGGNSQNNDESYWKVSEESIDGVCDVTYQVNELPEYMVKDYPELTGQDQGRQGQQGQQSPCSENSRYFELTKTKDVSSCTRRASFSYYKPGHYNCPTGNCDGMWSRSSITRFIGCTDNNGQNPSFNDLKIQAIHNEGELHQDLFGMKTEKFLTGVRQVFKLINEQRHSEEKQQQQKQSNGDEDTITVRSLMYEISFKAYGQEGQQGEQKWSSQINEEGQNQQEQQREQHIQKHLAHIYQSLPRNVLTGRLDFNAQPSDGPNARELIPEMQKLFRQLVKEDLYNTQKVAEKRVTMKILNLARGFTNLQQDQIQQLYQQLQSEFGQSEEYQPIFKNIFFDTLVMGGTRDCLNYLKQAILNDNNQQGQDNQMTPVQKEFVLMLISKYVTVPDQQTMQTIMDIVTSDRLQRPQGQEQQQGLRYPGAILGFSILVEKACIAENRDTAYPTFVYRNICHQESQIVQQWISYLQQLVQNQNSQEQQGNQADRNLAIVALGLLSHQNVVPILMPIAEGRYQQQQQQQQQESQQDQSEQLSRYLAIYSLANVGRRQPEAIQPVMFTIFNNPAEKTETRVAAFNVLMKLNPSMTVFHKIAALTWREQNREILELVNTAFYSLSTMPESQIYQDVYQKPDQSSVMRKAQLVYPIIKKTGGDRFPTTATYYNGDYLRELGVGFQSVRSWSGNEDSVFPQNYFSRVTYYLNRYQFNIYEYGIRMNGVENIIEELVQLIQEPQQQNNPEEEQMIRKAEQQLDSEWKKVIEQLQIKTREGSNTEGVFYLNLIENAPFFAHFQAGSRRMLRQKIREMLKNPQESLAKALKQNGQQFNFQRSLDLSPGEWFVPSDMGLPIVVEVHMPVVLSIRGRFEMELNLQKPTLNMNVKKLFAAQLTGWVGTICPFTKEYIVTGVDEHYVHNVPSNIQIQLNTQEQELKIAFQAQKGGNYGQPVDVFHYHVRPYTVHQSWSSLEPMTTSRNVNWIRSGEQQRSLSSQWGDYLGLKVQTHIQTESRYLDTNSVLEKLRLYNYNPLNMIRFSWASTAISERQTPSFRSHEYRITFDPSGSETKEIELWAKIGVATVNKNQQQGQGQQGQGQQGQYGQQGQQGQKQYHHFQMTSGKSGVKVESQPLSGHSQKHQGRQQQLEKALNKIEHQQGMNSGSSSIEEGTGVAILYTAYLRNGQSQILRNWSYNITVAAGKSGQHNRWHMELESSGNQNNQNGNDNDNNRNKICIDGQLQTPHIPIWRINQIRSSPVEYRYENKISFGRNCQEGEISVVGTAQTSEKQKEQSRQSPAAKKYEQMLQKNTPVAELSQIADEVRREATTLDEIDYKVNFRNVQARYVNYKNMAVEFLKSFWWQYLERSSSQGMKYNQGQQGQQQGQQGRQVSETDEFRFRFKARASAFDLTIVSPHGNTKFSSVRLPYWLAQVLPFSPYYPQKSGVVGAMLKTISNSGSSEIYPTCKVEGRTVQTYNNQSQDLGNLDQCFHLLSADCSSSKKFSILLRNVRQNAESPREMKIILGQANILLTPSSSHSKYNSEINVFVNGQQIPLRREAETQIMVQGKKIGTLEKTVDDVLRFRSYWVYVNFDGEKAEILATPWLKSKLCGICGNLDQTKSAVAGPKECFYSKTKVLVASYRTQLPEGKCQQQNSETEQQLREENERCTKFEHIPTKVSGSYKTQYGGHGPMMRHKHQVVEKSSEICISRQAVPECNRHVAKTEGGEFKEVSVSFTCLPKSSRTTQRYAEKARQGESLPEMENLPESEKMTLRLPKKCVPVNQQF